MAVVHHRAVAAPRGYGLAWSALGAGAAALIGFQLLHHPGGAEGSRPGSPFAAPSASSPAVHVSLPAVAPSSPGSAAVPDAGRSSSAAAARVAPSATPPPSTPTRPSPAGPGLVQVGAALVVPLRGSTPVAVRVAVVVPTAPPPWPPLLGLGYVR